MMKKMKTEASKPGKKTLYGPSGDGISEEGCLSETKGQEIDTVWVTSREGCSQKRDLPEIATEQRDMQLQGGEL